MSAPGSAPARRMGFTFGLPFASQNRPTYSCPRPDQGHATTRGDDLVARAVVGRGAGRMPARLVIGGQWGDEAKGKIIDALGERAAVVVRATGGNNAGHTVRNPLGEFKMHLIPCGIFHPRALPIIGNGVVLSPQGLLDEMAMLRGAGIDLSRLRISDRAHVV